MEQCNVCGNSNFTTKDGYYYCSECGTQTNKRQMEVELIRTTANKLDRTKLIKVNTKIGTLLTFLLKHL